MSVLLAIARVMASDQFGAHHPARALVDLVQRSHHRVLQCHTAVVEIFSRLSSGISRGHVTLTVSSRSVILRSISALVLLHLSVYGRALDSGFYRWSTELADPEFVKRDPVKLLLGIKAYDRII